MDVTPLPYRSGELLERHLARWRLCRVPSRRHNWWARTRYRDGRRQSIFRRSGIWFGQRRPSPHCASLLTNLLL